MLASEISLDKKGLRVPAGSAFALVEAVDASTLRFPEAAGEEVDAEERDGEEEEEVDAADRDSAVLEEVELPVRCPILLQHSVSRHRRRK